MKKQGLKHWKTKSQKWGINISQEVSQKQKNDYKSICFEGPILEPCTGQLPQTPNRGTFSDPDDHFFERGSQKWWKTLKVTTALQTNEQLPQEVPVAPVALTTFFFCNTSNELLLLLTFLAILGEVNWAPFVEKWRFRSLVRKCKKRRFASHPHSGTLQVPLWRISVHLEGPWPSETTWHPTALQTMNKKCLQGGGEWALFRIRSPLSKTAFW